MNHFQSRSCSKSQILIDWVTYRYFFLKFVVSESSRTSSILSDPLLRIVMNPHRSKIFPCFYTKQITRNPNSNMEQIFSMRLKDWCSKQCIAAEFLSFAEYLHVFSCKSCKSCIPQIRNTSWKFQKQSGAKVTQKWQKDTKTTFSNNFWSSGQTTKIRKFTCGTRKLLSGQSCAWQEVSTSHLSFFIWPQPQQPQCIYFHSLSCLFLLENDWNPRHSNDSYCWGFRQSWDPNLILSAFKPCLGMRTYFCYNKMINGKIRQDGTIQITTSSSLCKNPNTKPKSNPTHSRSLGAWMAMFSEALHMRPSWEMQQSIWLIVICLKSAFILLYHMPYDFIVSHYFCLPNKPLQIRS